MFRRHLLLLATCASLFSPSSVAGQVIGQATKQGGHYLASLDFLRNMPPGTRARITRLPHSDEWPNTHESNGIRVSGMVQRAVLVMDWWSLFGEPTENYTFRWWSSGEYWVSSARVNHNVTRRAVSQYPDLLRRFDAIKPLDIRFRIGWGLRDARTSIGYGEGLPWMSQRKTFSTVVNSGFLIGRSGEEPLSVPGIRQGNPLAFLGISESDLSANERRRVMRDFANHTQNNLDIYWFEVTSIRWPVGEMLAIAEALDRRRRGIADSTPAQLVEAARREDASTPAYPRNDEWARPAESNVQISLNRSYDGESVSSGVVTLGGRITGLPANVRTAEILGEGYVQQIDVRSDGTFTAPALLRAGSNTIVIRAGSQLLTQRITLNRPRSALRATLIWDNGNSDIDLYMTNPGGATASYRSKQAGGMELDVDNTSGYGPENIFVVSPQRGNYRISVNNYARGEGVTATVYVYVNEVVRDVKRVTFRSRGQTIEIGNYAY